MSACSPSIGVAEVAAALAVDRATAHRWMVRGEFGAWWRLPDGAPRVMRADAQAWLESRMHGGAAPDLFLKREGERENVKRRRVKGGMSHVPA